MTPKFKDLTVEQQAAIRELRAEILTLDLQADAEWAKYMKTGDVECYNTVRALESEAEMKGLIAYLPKAGEGKTKRIRDLIGKIKKQDDDFESCEGCDELPLFAEVRLGTLDGINAWREEYGIPLLERLPKGMMGDAHDCVIARAFSSLDTILIDDIEWQISEVSIGGEPGNYLDLYDPKTGQNRRLDIENTGVWSSFISRFDDNEYWDLVADEEIVDRVASSMIDGNWPKAGLEEIFRRGMVSDLVNYEDSLHLSFEDGKFTKADYDGDFEFEYVVGTVSPMEAAQYA